MELSFGEYLEKGTKKILEIVSSTSVSDEEKASIIEAFSEELSKNIGNVGNLKDFELLAYEISLEYIDGKISDILSNANAKDGDYDIAISLCERQRTLIEEFNSKGWSLPEITNTNVDNCMDKLCARRDSTSLIDKIIDEDHQISNLIQQAKEELSAKLCESANIAIGLLEEDLELAKATKTEITAIDNNDLKKARKTVEDIRVVAEKKEQLHQKLFDIDAKLHDRISISTASREQWREIIDICRDEADLLSECRSNNWPLPSLKCNPNALAEKYSHYIEMKKLDDLLVAEHNSLVTKKQYNTFYSNCDKQKLNIEVCNRNGWSIPFLANKNPEELLNAAHMEKRKRDKAKRWKNRLIVFAVIVVASIALILFGTYKYRAGKVQIPFDPEFISEENYKDIRAELTAAGFTNISEKEDNSGWLESGKVISVAIDYSDDYSKGDYCKPDVNVVITYSSARRKDATAIMEDWETKKYKQLKKSLKSKGFTNVTLDKVETSDSMKHHLISSVLINDESFVDGSCFIQLAVPIKIEYFVYTISIGASASSMEGEQYTDIVKSLKEEGFTNIKLFRMNNLINGWITKEGSINSISIGGKDDFKDTDKFACDAKIKIFVNTFKSKGCKDITEVAD